MQPGRRGESGGGGRGLGGQAGRAAGKHTGRQAGGQTEGTGRGGGRGDPPLTLRASRWADLHVAEESHDLVQEHLPITKTRETLTLLR